MCADFECLRHILKLNYFLLCWFWFFGGVGGQTYVDFKCLRRILKPKRFCFVGFGILQVKKVKCVLMFDF